MGVYDSTHARTRNTRTHTHTQTHTDTDTQTHRHRHTDTRTHTHHGQASGDVRWEQYPWAGPADGSGCECGPMGRLLGNVTHVDFYSIGAILYIYIYIYI